MNEEIMNNEVTEEINVTNAESSNEVNESEGTSESSKGTIIAGAAIIGVCGYFVGKGIEYAGKKAFGTFRNWRAKKKVKPDKDGCVFEAEAEEIEKETEKQENAQKKTKK